MSLTNIATKEDVMAWDPKKLADYMRQVSWFMHKKVNLCTSFSSYALMFYNMFPVYYLKYLLKLGEFSISASVSQCVLRGFRHRNEWVNWSLECFKQATYDVGVYLEVTVSQNECL